MRQDERLCKSGFWYLQQRVLGIKFTRRIKQVPADISNTPILIMSKLFISYRRSDSEEVTGRIYYHLRKRYGKVFKDVDSMTHGPDIREQINLAIRTSRVMLVIIGRDWVNTQDEKGNRRLSNSEDFVRIEIEMALKAPNIIIIPVLVSRANMPPKQDLPLSLEKLIYFHASFVRPDPDFNNDLQKLISRIDPYLRFQWIRRLKSVSLKWLVVGALLVFSFILSLIELIPKEKSLVEQYEDIVQQGLNVHAAWIPIHNTFKLGDYGLFTDGVFQKLGNIKDDFGVSFFEIAGEGASLSFVSDKVTVVNNGKTADNVRLDVFKDNATYKFLNAKSFLVHAPVINTFAIENIDQVAYQVKQLEGWKNEFNVVYRVYTAQSPLIISTIQNGTEVTLSQEKSTLKKPNIKNVPTKYIVKSNKELGLSLTGNSGIIALEVFKLNWLTERVEIQ
ncbi:MAG: toll/interleukin-1 receptor domain-containing protein [Spirosoma sp.]|nr:toll/interleukin-1 receptor domain-containing protein [Spirosoma sp.]